MFKRLLFLTFLISGLVFVSCEKSNTSSQNVNEISAAQLDIEAVEGEVENVVGLVVTLNNETMDSNEEVLESEGSLGKTAGYGWDGQYHSWTNTVDTDNGFHGEFIRKIGYKTSEDGSFVKRAGSANFMTFYTSAVGTWGFIEDDPDYGTKFNHYLEGTFDGFKTLDYTITATGQYSKINYCQLNDEDAVLDYTIKVDITELKMRRAVASSISLNGEMTIDMSPWKAVIVCDGTQMAAVTVYKDGAEVSSFDYDLTNLLGSVGMVSPF